MYSPALTRGWHSRAWRGVSGHPWASAGLTGPYLKAGCTWLWALSCDVSLQIRLDVGTLRPRVPALELVSAVAGMPGRDAMDKARG